MWCLICVIIQIKIAAVGGIYADNFVPLHFEPQGVAMQGTITLKLRELAIFGFGLTVGMVAVVTIVVSTKTPGSYLHGQSKKRSRRKKREEKNETKLGLLDSDSWM